MPVPMRMHVTSLISTLLLSAALAWANWTQANVVVRGQGRMRPVANAQGIEAVSEEISTEVAGRIQRVFVRENQKVRQGDLLFEMDTQQLDHRIVTIEAELAAEQQNLVQLEARQRLLANEFEAMVQKTLAEIEEAQLNLTRELARREAKIAAALAELELAREKFARMSLLHQSKAITPQELSEARTSVTTAEQSLAESQLDVDEQRLVVLQKTRIALEESHKTKTHESEIAQLEKHAAIERKTLELAGVRRDRLRSRVTASVDGVITNCRLSAGDVVQAGPVGITIQPERELEMVMTVSAADVGQLRLNMPVRIKMDAFDHQTYGTLSGRLQFISPDSTVDSKSPQQGATYALRVSIADQTFAHHGAEVQLKLGMTGTGEVVVERDSLLSLMLRKVRHIISL